MSEQAPGRRSSVLRRRRVDILVALGVLLPAVVGVSGALIGEQELPPVGLRPPQASPLTAATVVCPAAAAQRGLPVRVTRVPGVAGGELSVSAGGPGAGMLTDADPVSVEPGSTAVAPRSAGATVLDGAGAAAPGIIAGRGDALAVPECRAPSYDEWFVGLGASARYASTLELVNPDDGDAVVDVALYDGSGPVDEPKLRGIRVPGHGVKRIDLAADAPRRASTAARLTVTRGRVTATVRNTWDPLGAGRVATDFLPADESARTESLILGLPEQLAGGTLFLANPGEDQVRATVRLVTRQAVFAPTGAGEVSVDARSVKTVNLGPMLSGQKGEGVVGLVVESSGPMVSSVRLLVRGDLALLAPAPQLRDPTAAVLPEGPKTLVLGGAQRSGTVRVRAYDAAGKEIAEERVEVGADRAATLALPPQAVMVTVEPRNTPVAGTFVIPATGGRPGLATLRLRAGETHALIPDVRPQ